MVSGMEMAEGIIYVSEMMHQGRVRKIFEYLYLMDSLCFSQVNTL